MSEELNRLRWRCRRGMLELDIVLERFLEQHFLSMTPGDKMALASLLAESDNDLWDMISGVRTCDVSDNERILALLRQC